MEKSRKDGWKKYLIAGVVLLAAIGAFSFYNRIETVNVKGCHYYSDEEIRRELGNGCVEKNSVLLYLKYRYWGLDEIPFIEKLTIKRVNSHEITVHVYEKSLIACVKYMGQYLYFDKDGIILDSSTERQESIPAIGGLNFSGFTMYDKLKVENEQIFDHILELSQVIKRYELPVDKVYFNNKKEVTLTAQGIKIYLGKRDFYDESISALSEILPDVLSENKKGSIDMENYNSGDKVIFRVLS